MYGVYSIYEAHQKLSALGELMDMAFAKSTATTGDLLQLPGACPNHSGVSVRGCPGEGGI